MASSPQSDQSIGSEANNDAPQETRPRVLSAIDIVLEALSLNDLPGAPADTLTMDDHKKYFFAFECLARTSTTLGRLSADDERRVAIAQDWNQLSDKDRINIGTELNHFQREEPAAHAMKTELQQLFNTYIFIAEFAPGNKISAHELESRPGLDEVLEAARAMHEQWMKLCHSFNRLEAVQVASGRCSHKAVVLGKALHGQYVEEAKRVLEFLERNIPLRDRWKEAESQWYDREHEQGHLSAGWMFVQAMPAGGFGQPTIIVKQGPDGRIIDRAVMKDTKFDHRPRDWDSPRYWMTNPQLPGQHIPVEVKIMYDLRARAGSECVPHIRGWRINSTAMYHRIFMEFCPFGDLDDVIRRCQAVGDTTPEAFAWHLFESLAIAGLLMERGESAASPFWNPIIHSDYKPANVFLGVPLASRFRGYPCPKLGDYGLAYHEYGDGIAGGGTLGYMAPEQQGVIPRNCNASTNVWGTGIVIFSLLQQQEGTGVHGWAGGYDQPEWNEAVVSHYSKALIGLTDQCIEMDPDKRPTFDQILHYCQIFSSQGDRNECSDLREAPVDDEAWGMNTIQAKADAWPMGSLLADNPNLEIEVPRPPIKRRRVYHDYIETNRHFGRGEDIVSPPRRRSSSISSRSYSVALERSPSGSRDRSPQQRSRRQNQPSQDVAGEPSAELVSRKLSDEEDQLVDLRPTEEPPAASHLRSPRHLIDAMSTPSEKGSPKKLSTGFERTISRKRKSPERHLQEYGPLSPSKKQKTPEMHAHRYKTPSPKKKRSPKEHTPAQLAASPTKRKSPEQRSPRGKRARKSPRDGDEGVDRGSF